MSAIKLGVRLQSLKMPLRSALTVANRLGATAVEIDARHDLRPSELTGTALRQLRKMLADLNLTVASVRFLTRRGYAEQEQLDRRVEATKGAMRMAAQLGAQLVVNQIGTIPESPDDPQAELLAAVVEDLGRFGQHVGAWLACETGTEPLDRMGQFLDRLPSGSAVVALNPGNLLINGYNLEPGLASVVHRCWIVEATDGVPDRARGRGNEVPLGRGMADFPAIVGQLSEAHYQGHYVVGPQATAEPIESVAQALRFLTNM